MCPHCRAADHFFYRLRSLNERAHLLTRVFRKTPSSVGRSNSVQQTLSRKCHVQTSAEHDAVQPLKAPRNDVQELLVIESEK